MRYVSSVVIFAAALVFATLGQAAAPPNGLTITNYHMLSEVRQTRTTSLFTYSADLSNTGQAQPSITATVTSLVPSIVVQSGAGSLHFPAVAANATVTSTNTFSVMVDKTSNTDFANLVWQFSTPVANAGPGQTVTVGSTVTLNGSGSTNPSGIGTLTYSWAFATNGKPAGSVATIQNPLTVMPTFVVDLPGSYTIILTVSNGAGVSSSSVTITTTNSPPVANAGPNQSLNVGSVVVLNGSQSSDVDGDPLTYAWSLVQVPAGSLAVLTNPTTVSPTFTADLVGTYKAQLLVNDGHVNSTPSIVTITSNDVPPIAHAGSNRAVNLGSLVQLDGSSSTDVDGHPLTYRWSFNALPAGSHATLSDPAAVKPTFTADAQGAYIVQLIVNDGFDDSLPVTVTISTNAVLAPTANAGPAQTVLHGALVTLSGSGTDPQGLPLTYAWAFQSTPSGSTAVLSATNVAGPKFTADLPGSYVVQLIVNNGVLSSAPSTVTITTTNTAPTANAGTDQTVSAGALVTLNGSGSNDPDNDPLTYAWSLLNIPAGSAAVLVGANTLSPTFIADTPGLYVAQLIVKDPYTTSAPSTVRVTATGSAITLTPDPLNILLNGTGMMTVTLPSAPAADQTVNLGVIDTGVATAPPHVTVSANTTSATFTVTAAGSGTTQILASSAGFQPGLATVNVAQPSISLGLSNSVVGLTKTITGTITLSDPVPAGGITFSVSANPGGIVTIPSSVLIASGTTGTFSITGAAAGQTIITVSAPFYLSGSATVTASVLGAIQLQSGLTVAAGQTVPFAVSLITPAPAGGVTINLLSGTPSQLTVASSVFIAAGATSPAVDATVTGVLPGTVSVTASAPGFTGTSVNVNVVPGLSVSPSSLPTGTMGSAYGPITITASGGVAPYVLSSANLPAGLTFNPATGVLSGTPTAMGTGTITATDSSSTPLSKTLSVQINSPQMTVTPTSLPNGIVGAVYGPVTISATGGVGPYILSQSGLPAGMTFNTTTGVLGGTPSATSGNVTITVSDSEASPQTVTRTFSVVTQLTVSPATLADGVQGTAYPQTTITASGGTSPYTMSASGLPAGLTFNAATGVLSGTPGGAGSVTITVSDAGSPAQTVTRSFTIASILTVTPTTLPSGTVSSAYTTTTVAASGGTPPYILSSSGVPNGMTFNTTTGVLSGTPTATGTGIITVTDSGSTPQAVSRIFIVSNVFTVLPASLPGGVVGSSYSPVTILASGGQSPYTMTAANLPSGLSFNSATGVLSGTPTGTGTGTITIKDSSSTVQTMTRTVTVVTQLVVTPSTLTPGVANSAYPATTIAASGGTAPYTMSASGLPTGLLFNSATGQLSGTPTAPGTATITVTDSSSPAQTVQRTVNITSQLTVSPTSLPGGTVGLVYGPITLTPGGGTAPYSMSSANIPAGMSFNPATGVLGGTPTTYGTGSITINDSSSPALSITLFFTITPPPLVMSPNPLPNGAAGAVYPTTTVSATGGTLPYTFAAANLPVGMSFNTTTGVLSGTPGAGAASVTITVTDSTLVPAHLTASLSFTINPPMVVTPNTLPFGAMNVAYTTTTISASGGTPPYILTSANLPAGISFNSTTGVLSGTPSAFGSGTITVKDSTAPSPLTSTLTLSINPPLVVSPNSLPNGVATVLYPTTTISASGGTAPYTLSASGLPAGLTFNTISGVLSGTPTVAGTGTISIKDSTPNAPTATLSVVINPALTISPSLPDGMTGQVYPQATMTASGGTAPYTFTANLPAGLTFNPTTGILQGTPTSPGSGSITVHDSSSPTPATASVNFTVIAGQLFFANSTLPDGSVNASYSATVTASGGTPPFSFSATGLPNGLTMRSSGQITGVPTTSGTSTVTLTVTDSTSPAKTTTLSGIPLKINPPVLAATTTSLPSGMVGTFYSQSLTATGGTLPYTWTLTGSLPDGLVLSGGRIMGTPTTPVTTTFTLTVSDSSSPQQSSTTQLLTLVINPTTPFLTVSNVTVGRNLEATLAITLSNFSSATNITITSDNPNVLLSKFAATAGTPSVTVTNEVSNFIVYAQGFSDSGTANITAHASTFGSTDGTAVVTLAPSGFVISGPNGIGASFLSNQNATTPLTVMSEQLDTSGNVVQPQQLAAGVNATVVLNNSNSSAGSLPATASFTGGVGSVTVNFVAGATLGSTIITANEPSGYSTPSGSANMITETTQATQMTPSNASVGQFLQTTAHVTLGSNVTSDLTITLTSSDPSKVLLSTDPTAAGKTQITMIVRSPSNHTQDFYVYGLVSSGTVGYTAQATGFGTATGLVTLTPSGFALESPFGLGQDFFTVTNSAPTFLTVDAVQLDASGNVMGEQALAGGQNVNVAVTSANGLVGSVVSPVNITGNNASASTSFTATGPGTSLISVVQPSGFSTPLQDVSLTAHVNSPNILIDNGDTIGANLEQQGTFFLGAPAPAGGTSVLIQVTSGLLELSPDAVSPGSSQIMVTVPAGQFIGQFFMYGRDTLGSATIKASATGYNSATGTENLAPSGFVAYGPLGVGYTFTTSLAAGPKSITVASALLDSNLFYVANQPLAPLASGNTMSVSLTSGDTTIGTIGSPAIATVGSSTTTVQFTPIATGPTLITVPRPLGFSGPSSGGTLPVTVTP